MASFCEMVVELRACLEKVAAGVSPAVKGGILPPGDANKNPDRGAFRNVSAGQDAQLYGWRDARRYNQGRPSILKNTLSG